MPHNNAYDRDLPANFYEAETSTSREEALNVLDVVHRREQRKKNKSQAIRASYISPIDTF